MKHLAVSEIMLIFATLKATQMNTRILLTMALMVCMTLTTGCSKDESSEESGKVNGMEQKEIVLNSVKQHIVGTWEHDGDFVCADLSELTGTINDCIISGCTSKFIDSNPATLSFGTDGGFLIQRKGGKSDWAYTGTYTISRHDITGELWLWLKFDKSSYSISEISQFDYHEVFFEEDYNTVYLVAHSWAVLVSRYRRK